MYCASVNGSGCGCGGACDDAAALGEYPVYSQPFRMDYYTPGFGVGMQEPFNPFGGTGQQISPLTTSPLVSASDRHWYDGILGAAGDVLKDLGEDALDYVKRWLSNRVGEEAWERAPEETKRAFVHRALEEYSPVTSFLTSPAVLIGGSLAAGYLLFRRPKRSHR